MPSTSRSRSTGRGADGTPRTPVSAPMSERQQLALVMQISQQRSKSAAPTPAAEERKRTRQQRNGRGETPLHVASIKGDLDIVKKLLDQDQDPNIPDFAGWTPLHEACSYGWFPVVELLVNSGANLNAKGLDDDTPLHDATTSGNLQMVQFLVEHGADPFFKNTKGKMPSDYAATPIFEYLESLSKDSIARATQSHVGRARDDSVRKGNASSSTDCSKRSNMEPLAAAEPFDGKDPIAPEKDTSLVSSGVVSSTQDEPTCHKRAYQEENQEQDPLEDDLAKRRKKNEDKEIMGKPAPPRNTPSRVLTGSKPPGPASKTGATPLGKGSQGGKGSSGKVQSQGKASKEKSNSQAHSSKSSERSKSLGNKNDRKSPIASPKQNQIKQDVDSEDDLKPLECLAPKVPPLKIVIPGGSSAGSRTEQEGEGQRGSGKGRGSGTLPYVIPCTADNGQTSDSSDGNDDKRVGEGGKVNIPKPGQRVLRSHKTVDDKDKERSSHHNALHSNKSPQYLDNDHVSTSKHDTELHPRKRKIKKEHREPKSEPHHDAGSSHLIANCNPYQMYIHIRKQIDRRQKLLFPVKPKPPKDFNKYLMNRCTYTLQGNVSAEPAVEIPITMPPQMIPEFRLQEKERTRLRIQHIVEKEKLVLAVEQEILRVHGRAERAMANQPLPFSVCTMLRDKEVYNVLAPEQEEKRNAQRSRCNGRQINSWLQEVDDKWEKIKEGMLRRQHTEATTLLAVQSMGWEWKLKEFGLCDYKSSPKIDTKHVPQIHVSNFDLPA